MVGPENRLAEVAVHSVLDGGAGDNPLVFYGPSGAGKSHLARGIAAAWKARRRRGPVVCVTAVDFARELDDAVAMQAVADFHERYGRAGLLVVEDVGQLAQRDHAQAALAVLLDALLAARVQVVLTAPAAPEQLVGIEPRLQSRLGGGLTVPLVWPGPEARLAVLRQCAELRGVGLSEAAAQALSAGLRGCVPELVGAVVQLAMAASGAGGAIDLEAAREYVDRRLGARRVELREIAVATARHFSLRLSDLRSASRRRVVVRARGVAMYLARELAGSSLNQIGSFFGGRDHTTVLHGCRRTKELLSSEPAIRQAIQQVGRRLQPV